MELFPAMPLAQWRDTKETLHRFCQVVGKIRLGASARRNHWWNVPFHLTGRGITSRPMGRIDGNPSFTIDFDFLDHQVRIHTLDGGAMAVPLQRQSVASFHGGLMAALATLGITVSIAIPRPFDLPDGDRPFAEDTEHASYDPAWATRYWQVLSQVNLVLEEFAAGYAGKVSPVHHFWHTFDIAHTRFSGRQIDQSPSSDPVTREAYSEEVISFGFWLGDDRFPEPAFYAYTAPEPAGLASEPLRPRAAGWMPRNGSHLAVLRYDDVRAEHDPRAGVLDFYESAYQAGARLAGWDVERLACPGGITDPVLRPRQPTSAAADAESDESGPHRASGDSARAQPELPWVGGHARLRSGHAPPVDTSRGDTVVTEASSAPGQKPAPEINTSVPQSARIWNYWLGGKDHFPVDRAAGDQYIEVFPGIVDIARASRGFLTRAVRYLASETRVRQFLDIGTGLPTADNTHQVAQAVAPESRIVYVDNDPLVLVHARALLTSSPEGATDYVDADLHDPDKILEAATATLDFGKPVALMLMGIMGHVADYDEARSIVRRLLDGLPSGSHLALNDGTNVISKAFEQAQEGYNRSGAVPYILRSPQQIAGFFDGLELVEPGVVSCPRWRPDPADTSGGLPAELDAFGGVGRKP